MAQGRMTEEQAYAKAKQDRLSNDIRRGVRTMGPPLPPKMADSAGATGGPSFTRNPFASEGGSAARPRAAVNAPRVNTDLTRSDIYKGATSPGSMIDAKKPIINMRAGMGNSAGGYNRANETPVADASKELRGYGYDLMARKGKSFEEAKKLMSGTEQFRGLSESARNYVMNEFDAWWNNQTAGGKPKREVENVRRGGQPSMSQAPNRKPDTATANLARVGNSIDNVGY